MTNVRELKMPQSSGSEPSPKPAESPPNEIQHTSTRFVSNIIATSTVNRNNHLYLIDIISNSTSYYS